MYNHSLIELLKTFSNKEMMWFGKFLNSPYFNNRKRIIRLFKILRSYYPHFDNRKFTKENIHKLLYRTGVYNDSTIRNLMSDLLQLSKQYLKQEGMEKKTVESSFYLTRELFKRGQVNLFRYQMLQNENILETRNIIDGDYFLYRSRIQTDSFYINLMTQKILKKSFATSESEKLISGIVYILSFFIVEAIKHNDNLLKYSRTYNIKRNIDTVSQFLEIFNFDKMISYIRNNSLLNIPIIEVYYNLLKTSINYNDDSYYKEFKKSLLLCSKHLGVNDNNFLYSRLIDYCVFKKNLGLNSSFNINKEIFELHDIYIRNGYYKTESSTYLPFDIYRNVLINCITLKKLSFMQEFISVYSKKLIPEHITSVENYSYALLYFEKHMFSKALSYINKIKFDQFVYKLDMKNLQLKISYELEQFESAISVIDTYKHFLKNNELISESKRVIHKNFLSYTYNLIQYRTGSKKINLSYIANKVEKSKNTFNKEWILDKIYEQTGKYKKSKVA